MWVDHARALGLGAAFAMRSRLQDTQSADMGDEERLSGQRSKIWPFECVRSERSSLAVVNSNRQLCFWTRELTHGPLTDVLSSVARSTRI